MSLAVTSVLPPTDDTYIDSAAPGAVYNYDPFDKTLHADYSYIGPYYRHSLLKFDLQAIPADAVISSATLHMFCLPTSDEHTFLYGNAHDGWSEAATSWSSFESYLPGSTLIGDAHAFAPFAGEQWIQWDINLASWNSVLDLADGFLTLVLKGDVSDLNYSIGSSLCSKEYLSVGGQPYVPHLDIRWTPEPATGLGLLTIVSLMTAWRYRGVRP